MTRLQKTRTGVALVAAMLLAGAVPAVECAPAWMPAPLAQAQEQAAPQLTLEDIQADGQATMHMGEYGGACFIEGSCADGPVLDMDGAAQVVASVTDVLGGGERTQFEPWRTLTDASGNRYYVFRQMYDNTTVSGGAIKVVTDPQGRMLGLVSSVETELPDVEASEGIDAAAAEELVVQYLLDATGERPEVLTGRTERIILPVNRVLDPYSEEEREESRFVWVVYTLNTDSSETAGVGLPYLAHYVTMDGEYLYSLPTVMPGDDASSSGYDASYVFNYMEPVDYTGTVSLSDGTEREISVTLMRDSRTGVYYLGNIERRIVVADCYEFLYNEGVTLLESSVNNADWDDADLLTLYNYCRAYDYYAQIGWYGADGLETPIIILKDFCDENHVPIDNAAYAGRYYGWQLFLASSINDFYQCLDILAHEYTHGVTDSVLTYNAYMNDSGAIDEALSDIQGNICEAMFDAISDPGWLIGEDGSRIVRSMSDPQVYSQPERAWDFYYLPETMSPNTLNDYGGVHINSSLLNSVAYQLIANGGMTLEEARAYWFAVSCSMVPGTDYAQLRDLLPWVMRNVGMRDYLPALEAAIQDTRLGMSEPPSVLDEDQALVTLVLPDTEVFESGDWTMQVTVFNPALFVERTKAVLAGEGKYAGALGELLGIVADAIDPCDLIRKALPWTEDSDSAGSGYDSFLDSITLKLRPWEHEYFDGVIFQSSGAAGEDGLTVSMMSQPGLTIPVLMSMDIDENSGMPKTFGMAVYLWGTWFDLAGPLTFATEGDAEAMEAYDAQMDARVDELVDRLMNSETMQAYSEGRADIGDVLWYLASAMFTKIDGGQTFVIPNDGLESAAMLDEEILNQIFGEYMGDYLPMQ